MAHFFWEKSVTEVCQILHTDLSKGLTEEQVLERSSSIKNILPKKPQVHVFKLILSQFSSIMVWLLLVAALVAYVLGEKVDAIAIFTIIMLNAGLGFFQEFRAEKSLESLQKLSVSFCKVTRKNALQTLASADLVEGDLVLIEAGDKIPADGRVIHSSFLAIDESSLTGESTPVLKKPEALRAELPLADRKNMVFMGTAATSGRGYFLVTAIGCSTEIGKIADRLLQEERRPTVLQQQLDFLGKRLVYVCLLVVAVVFALGVWQGNAVGEMLLLSLSLAVAAIPEGLPAAVTIALSIGIKKMLEKKALIRRLSSIETLGCTTVICTDKTGTLTQNTMTVLALWVDKQFIQVTGIGYEPKGTLEPVTLSLPMALKIAVLCNHANILEKNGKWVAVGDPTEAALLAAAGKYQLFKAELEQEYLLVEELPFDSERKRMSILREKGGEKILFVKGACDVLLGRCKGILIDGEERPLTEEDKNAIQAANLQFTQAVFRVLAVCYRRFMTTLVEEELVFVGLFAIQDPIRPEVKEAVEKCRLAHIKIIMATGDHKETALAVAHKLGIEGRAVFGQELDALEESEIPQIAIFSRINAEHKLRIIHAYKKTGDVTAMTGDGVNDAPAIKAADIGIAMGITGSDVAKESADMILLDDNFASIVNAVEVGRGIYDNIVKFVSYLLSSNIAEILVLFMVMLLRIKDPHTHMPFIVLLPVQLLWMNLITDGFPAIALALDPVDPNVMRRPVRKQSQKILHPRFFFFILSISGLVTIGALIACFVGIQTSTKMGQTMTFTTLIVLELVRVQMIRKQYGMRFFSNRWLLLSLLLSFILQLMIIYIPFLQVIFGTTALEGKQWLIIIGITCALWIIGQQVTKLFYRQQK